MKLVVEPPMTVDLSLLHLPRCFSLFFWARWDVEGEKKSCRPPVSISHVPVLTELTDFSFSQRVHRIVETTPFVARTGERDPVPKPARTNVRFAERVDEQTLEGTVATSSSRSSSTSSSCPSSSQTANVPSMQVDESNQESSKRHSYSWC